MPNLIERRRMKRRQMAAIQSPVYNIYYTESVPIHRIPMFSQNHAQSLPQLNQSIYPNNLVPQRSSFPGRNIRNENDNKNYGVPIFSDQDQTHCSSLIQYQNQDLRNNMPDIVDRQQSLPHNLCGYGADNQINNSIQSSPYQSHDRTNVPNQHITLPAQPIGSTEGYSMKIEVLATPLKGGDPTSKNTLAEKLVRSCEDNSHFVRIDDSMRSRNNQIFVEPVKQILYRSEDGKKRLSLLSKIKRKINGKKSQSVVDDNKYHYRSNSAQEILSPRQLLESSTNVCSSIQSSGISGPSNDETIDFTNVKLTTFQEALKNLEDTLKDTDVVKSPSVKIPDSDTGNSAGSFVCESCKLKSDNDVVDHSRMIRVQESRGSTSSHSRVCRENSCKLWQSPNTSQSLHGSLDNLHHNTRQHRSRFNDHSPPEKDQPTQLRQCTESLKGNDLRELSTESCPPACCGLVMYGQNHAIAQYDQYYN